MPADKTPADECGVFGSFTVDEEDPNYGWKQYRVKEIKKEEGIII